MFNRNAEIRYLARHSRCGVDRMGRARPPPDGQIHEIIAHIVKSSLAGQNDELCGFRFAGKIGHAIGRKDAVEKAEMRRDAFRMTLVAGGGGMDGATLAPVLPDQVQTNSL